MINVSDQVRASFTGDLIGPDDPGYDETRRVHNGLIDKRPALTWSETLIISLPPALLVPGCQPTVPARPAVGVSSRCRRRVAGPGRPV